jgi:hypothetical protein
MNPGRCYKRIEIHGWRSWDLPIRDIESCLKKTSSISTASKIRSNWIAPRIPKFVQEGFKKLVDSLRQDSAHLAKGIRCKPTLPSCLADTGCRGLESLDDASEQAAATFENAKSNIKEIAEGAVRYGQRALTEQTGNWQKSFSNKVRAQKQLRKICVRNHGALAQQAEEMLRTLIAPLTICAKKNSLRSTMMLKISRAGARD